MPRVDHFYSGGVDHFLGGAYRAWSLDDERAYATLSEAIERAKPQVVNVSAAFNMRDCKNVWGRIFDRFDDVLFVLAAGNEGVREHPDICPGSMGSRYPNAITVAGVDSDGNIDESSNAGRLTVDIAAPFRADVLRSGYAFGTSFAAPAIANAALRLLAAAPWLSPQQLKSLLMEQCTDDALDVACGGQLDRERLLATARSLETR